VVLKIHVAAYPTSLRHLGWLCGQLNVLYDVTARLLFLKSIRPATLVERALAYVIVLATKGWFMFEEVVGWNNVPFLVLAVALAVALESYPVLVALTSFV
jgi:hypothetical protein